MMAAFADGSVLVLRGLMPLARPLSRICEPPRPGDAKRIRVLMRVLEFAHQAEIGSI